MLDSVGPFKLKKKNYSNINFYQFFKSRYGIGHSISLLICYFSGIHPFLKVSKLLSTKYESGYANLYIIKRIKTFFLEHLSSMDNLLLSSVISRIRLLGSIRSLRGRLHLNFLPVRGQRNRTNARTRKPRKDGGNENNDLNYTLDPSKLKKPTLKDKKKVMPNPKSKKGKNKK